VIPFPDRLSCLMIALAVFMTLCIDLYVRRRSPMLYLFCFFACLAALASSWFSFTVWVELSSIVLAFMVGKKDRPTARFYLYSQLLGGGLLLMASAMGNPSDGGLLSIGPVPSSLVPLFYVALGIKAALPLLHFWLPRTHSKAPVEASVLLSGYAVKMGIYGMVRMSLGPSHWLLFAGVFMALYGALQGVMQRDAKRLLAYSTMGQLGFMVSSLAAGTDLGRCGCAALVLGHALSKGLLFLSVGEIEKRYGTRDLAELGRGMKDLPWIFPFFAVGALSLAGAPLTAGGWGKSMVKAGVEGSPFVEACLFLAGLGTVLSLCKLGYYAFLRPFKSDFPTPPSVSPEKGVVGALSLFCVAILAVGVFPPFGSAELSLYPLKSLAIAVAVFCLVPWPFVPAYSPLDVDDLLPLLRSLSMTIANRILEAHSGNLTRYLFYLAVVAVFLMVAMGI